MDPVTFKRATTKFFSLYMVWEEVIQLIATVAILYKIPRAKLYTHYSFALAETPDSAYIKNFIVYGRTFGCLPFSYRNTKVLPFNMDNSQIILVTCDQISTNNFQFPNIGQPCLQYNEILDDASAKYDVKYQMYRLLPLHFLQTASVQTVVHNFITFGVMKPPATLMII